MKTLERMTNTEKAKLLHGLFPEEIPALISTMVGMLEILQAEEAPNRTDWDSGLFDPDFRAMLLGEAQRKVAHYGRKMHRNARLFADQLFDGYVIFCSVYCLKAYALSRRMYNPKFTTAVDLFYNL